MNGEPYAIASEAELLSKVSDIENHSIERKTEKGSSVGVGQLAGGLNGTLIYNCAY
jgi:hypothetical protein